MDTKGVYTSHQRKMLHNNFNANMVQYNEIPQTPFLLPFTACFPSKITISTPGTTRTQIISKQKVGINGIPRYQKEK
jgi:hypothetical protein